MAMARMRKISSQISNTFITFLCIIQGGKRRYTYNYLRTDSKIGVKLLAGNSTRRS